MNLISSFLTENKYTEMESYMPFRHTKLYLQLRLEAYNSSHQDKTQKGQLKKLAQALGYADHSFQKFMVHWKKWQRLEGKVPVKYFEAIGVQPEVLEFVQELDVEEFEYALLLPISPKNFVARIMAAAYLPVSFPEGTSEAAAIEIVQEYQLEKKLRCCIKIKNLKTIYIEPQQVIMVITYPPILKKEGGFYFTDGVGSKVGMTAIK